MSSKLVTFDYIYYIYNPTSTMYKWKSYRMCRLFVDGSENVLKDMEVKLGKSNISKLWLYMYNWKKKKKINAKNVCTRFKTNMNYKNVGTNSN